MNLAKLIFRPSAKKPVNLAEWLEVATRHMAPPVPARIRAEIEAHYAEAVQAKRERGWPEAEAQAAALADLGEAHEADARFCREYPSTLEALIVNAQVIINMFLGILLASQLIEFKFLPNPSAQPGWWDVAFILLFYLVVFLTLVIALTTLISRWRQPVTRRVIHLLLSVLWLNVSALIVMSLSGNTSGHGGWYIYWGISIFFSLVATHYSFQLLRLRKKMASARVENLPPYTPAASL